MEIDQYLVDRDVMTPFLLKLYFRTGAFHRPDEFSAPSDLPPHITLHTWPDATLNELTQLLAASASTTTPPLLPTPAIGTRLAFRHFYHDFRAGAGARLAMQDVGSVVIGDGGPGVAPDPGTEGADEGRLKGPPRASPSPSSPPDDAAKTLADVRFVAGDILSVAILPPNADGSVAGVGAVRAGRGYGAGSGLGAVGEAGNGGDRGFGQGRGGFGPAGLGLASMRWDDRGRRDGRHGRGAAPPVGEWRRGERLPDVPPMRGRGRGRPQW